VYFKVIKINQPPIIYMRRALQSVGKDIRTKSVKGEAKNLYIKERKRVCGGGGGEFIYICMEKVKKAEHTQRAEKGWP
jgi:hypothetical protein